MIGNAIGIPFGRGRRGPIVWAQVVFTVITIPDAGDGSIIFSNPSGGSGDYEYSIDGGISWDTIVEYRDLAPGTYVTMVRDANDTDLFRTLQTIVLVNPDAVDADYSLTNVTEFGLTDGAITFSNPSGGWGSYEYSIDNGVTWQAGQVFSNLGAAEYILKVRDSVNTGNETLIDTVNITQPAAPFDGEYVPYTPDVAVLNIEPDTVTWSENQFAVPTGVTEFSFEDDGNTWIFIYEEGSWNLYEHIPYAPVTSSVSYTEITLVANIQPGTVTFENNEFTVPGGVEEFSFEDDGQTWVFIYESEEWVLYEHVEYI